MREQGSPNAALLRPPSHRRAAAFGLSLLTAALLTVAAARSS
ncbi:hypothetical protein AB0M12_21815 [Nocardia vinacea]